MRLHWYLICGGCLLVAAGAAAFDWRAGTITLGVLTIIVGVLATSTKATPPKATSTKD